MLAIMPHMSSLPDAQRAQQPAPPRVRRWQALALACTIGLLLLGLGWELWWAPTGRGTLALKVLPLLPALPGLWRHRLYTYRWLSLLVWLYFTEGAVRATSEHGTGAALAAAEVALSLLLFIACAAYVRARLASNQPASNQETRA
jgi:uncharacterized membrane protein